MIYSSWDIVSDRLKLVIMSHFLPFYPPFLSLPKNRKNQNFEKIKTKKKNDGDISILQMYNKKPRIGSWAILLPFYTFNNLENQNFEQNENHLTQVMCPKNHDHDVWFLR